MRRTALIVLTATLLLTSAVPGPASAEYIEPDAFRFTRVFGDQSVLDAEFQPGTERALLVGGIYNRYEAQRFIVTYDGSEWDTVYRDQSAKGRFLDADWRPQGDAALILGEGNRNDGSVVLCVDPCESTDHLFEQWNRDVPLLGRQVDWHPSGEHALITGNGLMKYRWNATGDLDRWSIVDTGQETFYNAVAWHPSGDYALLSKHDTVERHIGALAICHAPCDSPTDLQELPFDFGKYDGSRNVEEIKFSPDGDRAYLSGLNHQRGLILELTVGNSTNPADWARRYIEPMSQDDPGENKYGEITGIDFHPSDDFAAYIRSTGMNASEVPFPMTRELVLTGSSIERQVMALSDIAGNATFTTLLDMSWPKMQGVAWDPQGRYAIFPSQGGFFRYDLFGSPSVTIDTQDPSARSREPIALNGTADPNEAGDPIVGLDLRVGIRGDWTPMGEANWTADANGSVAWATEVDPDDLLAGDRFAEYGGAYDLQIRARDDRGIAGVPDVTNLCVPAQEAPRGIAQDIRYVNNDTVQLGWYNLTEEGFRDDQVRYHLERSPDRVFPEATTETIPIHPLDNRILVNQSHEDGEMWYRVKATTCGEDSAWRSTNVTVPSELPEYGYDPDDGSDTDASGNTTDPDDGRSDGTNGTDDSDGRDGTGDDEGDVYDGDLWDVPDDPEDPRNVDPEDPGGSDDGADAQDDDRMLPRDIPGPGVLLALAAAAVAVVVRNRRR